MKDMKAALGNGSKPDITHVRTPLMNYIARACEYGSDKYERANYARPTAGDSVRENFERYRGYLRAALSHIAKTLDSMEYHLANDPQLQDQAGMMAAAFAPDTDVTPGAKVGASKLPHVAEAAASLNMAITQAARYGLLPDDPGQPWKTSAQVATAVRQPVDCRPIPDHIDLRYNSQDFRISTTAPSKYGPSWPSLTIEHPSVLQKTYYAYREYDGDYHPSLCWKGDAGFRAFAVALLEEACGVPLQATFDL